MATSSQLSIEVSELHALNGRLEISCLATIPAHVKPGEQYADYKTYSVKSKHNELYTLINIDELISRHDEEDEWEGKSKVIESNVLSKWLRATYYLHIEHPIHSNQSVNNQLIPCVIGFQLILKLLRWIEYGAHVNANFIY